MPPDTGPLEFVCNIVIAPYRLIDVELCSVCYKQSMGQLFSGDIPAATLRKLIILLLFTPVLLLPLILLVVFGDLIQGLGSAARLKPEPFFLLATYLGLNYRLMLLRDGLIKLGEKVLQLLQLLRAKTGAAMLLIMATVLITITPQFTQLLLQLLQLLLTLAQQPGSILFPRLGNALYRLQTF
jgi:hypothetical protein